MLTAPNARTEMGKKDFVYSALCSYPAICCIFKLKELIPLTALEYKMKEMEAGSQKCQCFFNDLGYVTVLKETYLVLCFLFVTMCFLCCCLVTLEKIDF